MPYEPRVPFVATLDDGTETTVGPGMIFADDHPLVKKYGPRGNGLLVDINATTVIQNPGATYAQSVREDQVEQATAAPGEVRRGPGRPRKS